MSESNEMDCLLPKHGYIGCHKCFPAPTLCHEFQNSDGSKWRIERPNAAWGARTPTVLVLGFSRGANQSRPDTPFDDVAFKGMRTPLARILRALGLLHIDDIDARIRASESFFAFGSLIRCSVAQWDEAKGTYAKSGGAILQRFAKGDITGSIARNCGSTFLAQLPSATKLVVMLGNEERYVRFCHNLIAQTRGTATWVNSVAYDSHDVRFVHVIHAKAQGRLTPDWLAGQGSQLRKRKDATDAVVTLGLGS